MHRLIVIVSALALAGPALAGPPRTGAWQVGNDSYHIYYDDLDMTTAAGRAALLTRVEAVAAKLCDMPVRVDQRACVDEVVAGLSKPELRRAVVERHAPVMASAR